MSWLYIFISVVIVSFISLIGVFTIALKANLLQKVLIYFVAFSAGALIGDSFLHLLPQATKSGFNTNISLYIFLGIALFFVLEKILRWRHCHDIDCHEHPNHLGTMNLVGETAHNFVDGALIASSYLVSIPLGITTTLAVVFHEIPHELGNFAVLLHSGFAKKRALFMNFLSATFAILGALVVVFIGKDVAGLTKFMIPFTAGGFIYVALSDLVPELHKNESPLESVTQFIFIALGVSVMVGLLFLE